MSLPQEEEQQGGGRGQADDVHSDSSFDEADDQDWADWVDDEEGEGGGIRYDPLASSTSTSHPQPTEPAPRDKADVATSFRIPTQALFPHEGRYRMFDSPLEALKFAKEKDDCDLIEVVKRLGLDALQVIRLVNHIRRTQLLPSIVSGLTGAEEFLNDDAELKPVPGLEDDGLLQLDFDEIEVVGQAGGLASASSQQNQRVVELEEELQAMRLAFEELRQQYSSRIGVDLDLESERGNAKGKSRAHEKSPIAGSSRTHNSFDNASSSASSGQSGVKRDDDTHYFNSYASNDIHQTMLDDSVRTLSYAKFLLSPRNASFIRGKTIMDVGCGSGILSLFCARAGAKEVLAIDASDVADRAKGNVEANGWGHVVKVKKGKLEDLGEELKRYEGKVDLIVSEWMGYFLLYESMLPSVLVARDRYLNPTTGLLAPSHCRMLLCAVSDADLLHQRIKFWDDVHGFTMPAMSKGLEVDAYTEGLSADKVVSTVVPIFDLPLQTMPARQPSFVSPFTIEVTKDTTIHGFLSWFDTWFVPLPHPELPPRKRKEDDTCDDASPRRELEGGEVISGLPPVTTRAVTEEDVEGIKLRRSDLQRLPTPEEEEQQEQGRQGEIVSFTTGPFGKETHWKQTVLILKEPLLVRKGQIISGTIHVVPSSVNSRELDAEVHWIVRDAEDQLERSLGDSSAAGKERKKKKVETMTVQVWAVR